MNDELIDLARDGQTSEFENLFAQKDGVEQYLNIKDEYTLATPLHMAAANNHVDLLKLILSKLPQDKRKLAVNMQNDSGNTPLHWAALNGSLETVKLLVDAGADPLKQNKTGIDACYQADSADQQEVANYLYSVVSLDEFDEKETAEEEK